MLRVPLILEGPDGAGKTSLALALAHLLDVPLTRNGPPPSVASLTDHYLSQLFYPGIIDRSWPSERIYGPRFRGQDRIGPANDDYLRTALASVEGYLILCLPPYETCAAVWRSRKKIELVQEEDTFKDIYAAYVAFADSIRGAPWARHFDHTQPQAVEKLLASLI